MKKKKESSSFASLTWNRLDAWAGTRIVQRGTRYQALKKVRDLRLDGKDHLIAWVEGSRNYAVEVRFKNGKLTSDCTCPYGKKCKHAIAVLVDYLKKLKQNEVIPESEQNDIRIRVLKNKTLPNDEDDEDDDGESGDFNDDTQNVVKKKKGLIADSGVLTAKSIRKLMSGPGASKLAGLIYRWSGSYPDIAIALECLNRPSGKGTTSLKRTAKLLDREIERVTIAPEWGEFAIPDYSGVLKGFKLLLKNGEFEALLALGWKFFKSATDQIEQTAEDGGACEDAAECMSFVFKALAFSRRSGIEKMKEMFRFEREDQFDLTTGGGSFWKKKFDRKDWSVFADHLIALADGESTDFKKEDLTDQAIDALRKAGREKEILSLYVRESEVTGSYLRLCEYYLSVRKPRDAELFAQKGLKSAKATDFNEKDALKEILIKIHRKDHRLVTAFLLEDFIKSPGFDDYKKLLATAEQCGIRTSVRAFVHDYLQTGRLKPRIDLSLPSTGLSPPCPPSVRQFPMSGLLLEIGLFEKDVEAVTRGIDEWLRKDGSDRGWDSRVPDRAAAFVEKEYPDKTLSVWRTIAVKMADSTNTKNYPIAVTYLKKMRKLLISSGRENEWFRILHSFRDAHIRKKNLIALLSRMSDRPIIEEG